MYREKKRYPKGDINFEISFRIAGILMNENIVKKNNYIHPQDY